MGPLTRTPLMWVLSPSSLTTNHNHNNCSLERLWDFLLTADTRFVVSFTKLDTIEGLTLPVHLYQPSLGICDLVDLEMKKWVNTMDGCTLKFFYFYFLGIKRPNFTPHSAYSFTTCSLAVLFQSYSFFSFVCSHR